MFQIINTREVDPDTTVKLLRTARERLVAQQSQQIRKIIAAVEHYPTNTLVQNES